MRVAVLALQGAFAEHERRMNELGAEYMEIRRREDLDKSFDALILPGGESTVMGKLLRDCGLLVPIRERIQSGLPVMGTCAGLILMAKEVAGGESHLATMDIRARRNAYGRQLGSFRTEREFGKLGPVPMTFIRAPYIEKAGEGAEILAEVEGKIVAARQGTQLAVAFHPELTDEPKVHEYFLNMAG